MTQTQQKPAKGPSKNVLDKDAYPFPSELAEEALFNVLMQSKAVSKKGKLRRDVLLTVLKGGVFDDSSDEPDYVAMANWFTRVFNERREHQEQERLRRSAIKKLSSKELHALTSSFVPINKVQ